MEWYYQFSLRVFESTSKFEVTDILLNVHIWVVCGFFQVIGFHQGILKLAMEPSLLGTALMEGGPNRKIKLDRSPGMDEVMFFICASG